MKKLKDMTRHELRELARVYQSGKNKLKLGVLRREYKLRVAQDYRLQYLPEPSDKIQ